LGEATKRLINRPRPTLGRFNPVGGLAHGPSLPSTHVSNYVSVFGFATWILWRKRSPAALPAGLVALALVILVGPSRIHSGDHRWGDVAAGYGFGAAYLAALIALAGGIKR
jgi:membrane-associated phospholipid phosphatase